MRKYAKVVDGRVTEVIVADSRFFDKFVDTSPGQWIETTAYDDENQIRKHPAGVGDIYDADLNAFYQPQPYPSWTLNPETCIWEAPVPKPDLENKWMWNESTQTWDWVKKYKVP